MANTYQCPFLLLHDGLDVAYAKAIADLGLNGLGMAEHLLGCYVHVESAWVEGRLMDGWMDGWMDGCGCSKFKDQAKIDHQPSRVDQIWTNW
jgi:hypothetical protein